jgi:hypothetical protein
MPHEIRKRIVREATPEEAQRHSDIRRQVESELPDLKKWARAAAARHPERTPVGTVLSADEARIIEAIDSYAAQHDLPSRSAVVREALAHLLGIDIVRQ